MRHGTDVRAEAVRCFEAGYAENAVGRMLGISVTIAKKWLYTYRALGKEALLVTGHNTYAHELKVEAARAVIEGRMSKPDAMKAYGLRSKTQIDTWCRLYREGGADALLPRPKGRPRKAVRGCGHYLERFVMLRAPGSSCNCRGSCRRATP